MDNKVLAILKKVHKEVNLSLAADAEKMIDKLNQDIIRLASDSYPVFADDTVFQQLIDSYQEITSEIRSLLSQYDYEQQFANAKELASKGDSIIQDAVDLKIKIQNQANELGVDLDRIEAYGMLSQSIDDAEESMKYVNSPWAKAYDDLKNLESL